MATCPSISTVSDGYMHVKCQQLGIMLNIVDKQTSLPLLTLSYWNSSTLWMEAIEYDNTQSTVGGKTGKQKG